MDIISTSGSGPSLDLERLASALSGTVVYGWFVGFSDLLDLILSGLTSTYQDIGLWLSDELIPALISIGLDPAAIAIQSNIEFIDGLGLIGIPVAAVELIITGWLIIQIYDQGIDILDGVFSA